MSKASKQQDVRQHFIEESLFGSIVAMTYNQGQIIIETHDDIYPFIHLSITLLTDEQATKKIAEISEKNKYHIAREKKYKNS